jgi:hypothetical protein
VRQSPASKDAKTEVEGFTALEAVTRQRLVKLQQTEDLVRAVVDCRVCELVTALQLLVVTICKCSVNPITIPNPIYSHTNTCQY